MKIAIVDDHAMVRAGIASILSTSFEDLEEVTEASCSQELLENFQDPFEFDLILLDYHLPGSVAEENYDTLARQFNGARILFLSSDESPDNIYQMIQRGAAGYMVKSSRVEILIPTIQYVMAGGTYLPTTLLSDAPKTVQAAESPADLNQLTLRQRQVFEKLLEGQSNKLIAKSLHISESTVKTHLLAAFKLLGVESRGEAIAKFKPAPGQL